MVRNIVPTTISRTITEDVIQDGMAQRVQDINFFFAIDNREMLQQLNCLELFFCQNAASPYTVIMEFELNGPDMMQPVAAEVIARAANFLGTEVRACVCTLSGDLGAGKTTLTQWIGKELGIDQSIQSPTFVIRKRYETTDPVIKQLIHIDAYRLNSGEELNKLRFAEDLQQSNTLICLEWPEQIADIKLVPDIIVTIQHTKNGGRTVSIQP